MSIRNIFQYISNGSRCYMRIGDCAKLEFTLHKSANSKYPFVAKLDSGREIVALQHLFNIYNKTIGEYRLRAPEPITGCVFPQEERFEDCSFEIILGCTPAEWDDLPALEEVDAAHILMSMKEPAPIDFDPVPLHVRIAQIEKRLATIEERVERRFR